MARVTEEKIKIPKEYGPTERRAIALEVIDFIIDRTKAGKDKDNSPFPRYSKSYTKSAAFKIGGKSKKVNLTLTGDMLSQLQLLKEKSGEITIGHKKGSPEEGRAEGNILGSYGGSPKSGRARDYLGITEDDLQRILDKYPIEEKPSVRKKLALGVLGAAGLTAKKKEVKQEVKPAVKKSFLEKLEEEEN